MEIVPIMATAVLLMAAVPSWLTVGFGSPPIQNPLIHALSLIWLVGVMGLIALIFSALSRFVAR